MCQDPRRGAAKTFCRPAERALVQLLCIEDRRRMAGVTIPEADIPALDLDLVTSRQRKTCRLDAMPHPRLLGRLPRLSVVRTTSVKAAGYSAHNLAWTHPRKTSAYVARSSASKFHAAASIPSRYRHTVEAFARACPSGKDAGFSRWRAPAPWVYVFSHGERSTALPASGCRTGPTGAFNRLQLEESC